MKKYYLQEKINEKWVTQAESNSRECLTSITVLDFANSETRIIAKSEVQE